MQMPAGSGLPNGALSPVSSFFSRRIFPEKVINTLYYNEEYLCEK